MGEAVQKGAPPRLTGVGAGLAAFVADRHPLALRPVLDALDAVTGDLDHDRVAPDALRAPFREALGRRLARTPVPSDLPEPTPRVTVGVRLDQAYGEVLDACDGYLRRASIRASLTGAERRELLRGMILTRAVDNRLKAFFSSGEVRYNGASFQGKGFRSLGQEAIYGAALRLRRGAEYRTPSGEWRGDVVAPVIRDLGVALAMRPDAAMVRMALNAQIGKAGPPLDGKDFNIGDFSWGILPPAAPLTISTMTVAGLAMAFSRERAPRVAVSFIGEGGCSLGEWHEAINICAVRRLPAVFCVQNNQTALSTPVQEQSAVRAFADKAAGYGVPGITLDGTDPEAIAAAFAWAAERAREGLGPTLIELVAMRMCGHAHHDDMLYLGHEPQPSWEYPAATEHGYVDRESYDYWAARDPIAVYAAKLEADGVVPPGEVERLRRDAAALVEEEAKTTVSAAWPDPSSAGVGVFGGESARRHVEMLDPEVRFHEQTARGGDHVQERFAPFARDPKGRTFLEGVTLGIADALRGDSRVFVYGEDVGGKYGNAFMLLRPLLAEFGERIVNAPLTEAGILGVCTGAALAGHRPIGEIQFNDFVATGFNQLVNNAAKTRYRWGAGVPMVVRMPFGGLRHAGPYHSQNTEAWFYRTPGLKIVVPSTPHDARALMAAAVADPDPVLYYEHIALYRDPRIREALTDDAPEPIPLGCAALRRRGDDLAIVSYGAYVHVALRVAARLSADGIEASVLDLRSLVPLDRVAVLDLARRCHRMLILHEDSRTGSVGESLAAIVQEEAFESLDAPVRILGSLDTPVPYSPPLEEFFLPSEGQLERAARLLVAY
jgi:2-oxoisovalerate dehydrogenase E1 component